MTSRKPSAKAKRLQEFRAQLEGSGYSSGADPFAREEQRTRKLSAEKEAALRAKACESKKRYPTRYDAECAIESCAAYGTTGLNIYRCSYCDGWHLTSKQLWDD